MIIPRTKCGTMPSKQKARQCSAMFENIYYLYLRRSFPSVNNLCYTHRYSYSLGRKKKRCPSILLFHETLSKLMQVVVGLQLKINEHFPLFVQIKEIKVPMPEIYLLVLWVLLWGDIKQLLNEKYYKLPMYFLISYEE